MGLHKAIRSWHGVFNSRISFILDNGQVVKFE